MRLDLNQQCHYDGRFTVSWGYQFSYTSIFGGPAGDRTPTKGLQSPCAPIITTSPNFGIPGGTRTPTNGFGDRHAAITPPRHNFNTLLRMCVLKHSKLLRLPVRKECFNTLGFFYVQEHKPSPRPPICSLE